MRETASMCSKIALIESSSERERSCLSLHKRIASQKRSTFLSVQVAIDPNHVSVSSRAAETNNDAINASYNFNSSLP